MTRSGIETAVVRLESLSKTYPRQDGTPVEAVHDLNLSLPAGQICGLIGPIGSGKTTVLRMVAGLATPTAGRILLNGHDQALERDLALRQAAVVIEGDSGLQESRSVRENLTASLQNGRHGRSVQERAERLLHELDLWDRQQDAIGWLSQGMQHLVAIACALAAEPPILLLDEPTQHLDMRASRQVESWIKQSAHERGVAVLLTTRQPSVVQSLCDRAVIICRGRTVADRSVAELGKMVQGDYYQIRILGQIEEHRSAWFEDLAMTTDGDETVLSGVVADQAALQGIIGRVRDLGIPLLSVTKVDPGLQQVLAHLMHTPPIDHGPDEYASPLLAEVGEKSQAVDSSILHEDSVPRALNRRRS